MRFPRLLPACAMLAVAACAGDDSSAPFAPSTPPQLGPPPGGNNTPPTLTLTAPIDGSVVSLLPGGTASVTASGDFLDPDVTDTHTCWIDWQIAGTIGNVTESGGNGSCQGTFAFLTAGSYVITMSVIDALGGTDIRTVSIDVVTHQPPPAPTGNVTGEGQFQLPLGGYARASRATGPVSFVAVLRHNAEGTRSRAKVRVKIHRPRVLFEAKRFDDIVLTGPRADFSGVGTLKGRGRYKFTLSVIDGDLPGGDGIDRVRFRVWGERGMIIDTEPGANTTDDPITPLDHGMVRIQ